MTVSNKTKEPAKLVRDPELVALDRIARTLNALPLDARGRVLAFVLAKYQTAPGEDKQGPSLPFPKEA